jgi:hypothetical protein
VLRSRERLRNSNGRRKLQLFLLIDVYHLIMGLWFRGKRGDTSFMADKRRYVALFRHL